MTSFWGYVTEGCLLLPLAFWWMVNTSVEIIRSNQKKREFHPKLTYPWPGTKFPVEIFYKLGISSFGILAQLAYTQGQFHDEEGNFYNMDSLMYISVYAIFLTHAILDLMIWFQVPLVKGSHYASAAVGFFWYALALHSKAAELQEEGVKALVRTFPVYVLFPISAAFVVETVLDRTVMWPLVRAFCLQTYATWCMHSAHSQHDVGHFPGSQPNPDWDPSDHRNVAYTAAFFGLHLCINLVLTTATYTLTAFFMRMRYGTEVDDRRTNIGYKSLPTKEDVSEVEKEAHVKLLTAYSTS